jgi:ureidoacrylate peracid hydrolase
MQNDLVSKGGLCAKLGRSKKLPKIIPKMKKLISFRRNKSIPIFYTQAVRKPSGINLLLNDHRVLPRSREERLEKIPNSVRGTWDADIIDEIESTDEDHLLIKRHDSAFQDTEIGVWRGAAYEFRCVKVCAVDQVIYFNSCM